MGKFSSVEEVRALLASFGLPRTADDHHRVCELYWSLTDATCFIVPIHTNDAGIGLYFADEAAIVPRQPATVEAAVLAAIAQSGPTHREPESFRGWRKHFRSHLLASVHDDKRGHLVVTASRRVLRESSYEPTDDGTTAVPTVFEPGALFNAIRAAIEAAT